jgi:hypothetical protein
MYNENICYRKAQIEPTPEGSHVSSMLGRKAHNISMDIYYRKAHNGTMKTFIPQGTKGTIKTFVIARHKLNRPQRGRMFIKEAIFSDSLFKN